jgi:hypothetical protein
MESRPRNPGFRTFPQKLPRTRVFLCANFCALLDNVTVRSLDLIDFGRNDAGEDAVNVSWRCLGIQELER